MGQYYVPLVISENGQVSTLYSHDFDNGLKLMEHSWIGNDFVNAVYSLIHGTPQKVAWIGDYSDEPYNHTGDAYAKVMTLSNFQKYYALAWDEKETNKVPRKEFKTKDLSALDADTKGMYLINHSLNVYLELEEYIQTCTTKDGYCVNPLPLLTACGNNRGGGDFHDGHTGYEDVGIWAFDLLEYGNAIPAGYHKVQYRFIED